MQEPYYFRSELYQYLLQSHPSYGFCVGRSDEAQSIWGLGEEKIELIWFDPAGNFRKVEQISWSEILTIEEPDLDDILTKATEFIREKFNLKAETVSVKRFWLENLEVGVEDFTETIKEFLLDRTQFDEEEVTNYEEILEEWKSEDQYVFWWGQDYYVNKKGFVETS
jgi:hypothetical protein